MTKLRVDQTVDAADPLDLEDIELRRLIAEALLATDLDLSLIAAGGAAPTLISHPPCSASRVRSAKPVARQHPSLKVLSTLYH
jgi:hypothetical protein